MTKFSQKDSSAEGRKPPCSAVLISRGKPTLGGMEEMPCGRRASFRVGDLFFCRTHARNARALGFNVEQLEETQVTTEPLTVEELERKMITKLVDAIVEVNRGCDPRNEEAELRGWLTARLTAFLQAHSRQLWLEAAEIAIVGGAKIGGDTRTTEVARIVARRIAAELRAKAESTPKPSPALPGEEK